ncbi:MAG: hypothetical protein QOH06_1104 [Acidobacteriota bacterium]|nr:hypothetical protein [Acidobacteriota bacterium]
MYGIKAAVRRLEFAPAPKDMEVTDIKSGRFVFRPRTDKPVSLSELRKAVTKAGYEIEGTNIEVAGSLGADGRLRVPETGQVFLLKGSRDKGAGGPVTVKGKWEVVDREEVIVLEGAGQ